MSHGPLQIQDRTSNYTVDTTKSVCCIVVYNLEPNSTDGSIALKRESVSSSGSYNLELQPDWAYPNCYLQLSGATTFRSTLFQIQASSGPSTTWKASATSTAVQSTKVNIPESSAAGSTSPGSSATDNTISRSSAADSTTPRSSAANIGTPAENGSAETSRPRPNVTLPNDGPDSQYVLPDNKTDCLEDRDIFYPDCWDVLNIMEWLPEWFISTPQCSQPE